jgi:hypothetical protein
MSHLRALPAVSGIAALLTLLRKSPHRTAVASIVRPWDVGLALNGHAVNLSALLPMRVGLPCRAGGLTAEFDRSVTPAPNFDWMHKQLLFNDVVGCGSRRTGSP